MYVCRGDRDREIERDYFNGNNAWDNAKFRCRFRFVPFEEEEKKKMALAERQLTQLANLKMESAARDTVCVLGFSSLLTSHVYVCVCLLLYVGGKEDSGSKKSCDCAYSKAFE